MQCWSKYIQSDAVGEHMKNKDVGEVDVAVGTFDDIKYNVFIMKRLIEVWIWLPMEISETIFII